MSTESSRDDFIIAIRSAFLKKGNRQKFSLFTLLIISILVLSLEYFKTGPVNQFRSITKDIIFRGSYVVSSPFKFIKDKYYLFQEHMRMNEEFINKSCVPNKGNITIEYGGTSGDGAKRVNIVMDTSTLHLQFNIRNTSSSGTAADPERIYPTHLQAGYRFKGETKMTHFWEAKDDTFTGVSSAALKMIN